MNLGWQDVINLCGGAFLASIGWFAHMLYETVRDLEKSVHIIEVDLPTNYIRRDEYGKTMERIETIVAKIFDKLDTKSDK